VPVASQYALPSPRQQALRPRSRKSERDTESWRTKRYMINYSTSSSTVVGYTRVSTAEQADSGAGLAAQRTAIAAEADRRGWNVLWIEDAGLSAATLVRPGIQDALRLLQTREASALVVAKLDRLSRSVVDFAATLDLARRQRWNLVALDLGVDLSTPAGEMMANVLASFSQSERRLISQRTREGLAAKKAAGVRLGRPRVLPKATTLRVLELRACGLSLQRVADCLNAEGVPTARGTAQWGKSSVAGVLDSAKLDALAAAA